MSEGTSPDPKAALQELRQSCATEIGEVLKKYGCRLKIGLQLFEGEDPKPVVNIELAGQ